MAQKSRSRGILKSDFGVNDRPILCAKSVNRSVINGVRHSSPLYIKEICFLRIVVPWKSGYFSVMKYIGFIILMRSECNFFLQTSVSSRTIFPWITGCAINVFVFSVAQISRWNRLRTNLTFGAFLMVHSVFNVNFFGVENL